VAGAGTSRWAPTQQQLLPAAPTQSSLRKASQAATGAEVSATDAYLAQSFSLVA
jgi:hypothetical protein